MRTVLTFAICISLLVARDPADTLPPALQALVETERAFARAAMTKGIRDSFLEYFADDAIALVPEAAPAKDRLRTRPARPFSELELTWEPRAGDVSMAGDLGWLTGPSRFLDHTASAPSPHYGNYLSIWRRQGTGDWRVFIDFGCDVPEPAPFAPGFTQVALRARWTGQRDRPLAERSLTDADRQLNDVMSRAGVANAYAAVLTDASRLHRQRAAPLVGRDAIVSMLAGKALLASASSTAVGAAASGDLGYAYGTYEVRSAPAERGAYLRVWARDAAGQWRLVVDATEPAR
jgi:ketosteroid isomerase-like protein